MRELLEVAATDQFAKSFDFFCSAVMKDDKKIFQDMYERILKQARVLEAMRRSAREGVRVQL